MEENKEQIIKTSRLIKKPRILLAGLILVSLTLLLTFTIKEFSKDGSPSSDQEQSDFAHTSLSLSEELRASSISDIYELDVFIDSDKNEIDGAHLEISYDPQALSEVDIKAGDFFVDPVIVFKEIDSDKGIITFAISNQTNENAVIGSGTLAVITFRKIGNEETLISFLPQTQISSPKINQSVLKNTSSSIISEISVPQN
jgi:hypothetical protein